MASVIMMPKLGLTMEKGSVVSWLKKEGDAVRKGEILLTVETDKITNDVESPESATVLRILVPEGEEVAVLTPLAVIGAPGERIPDTTLPAALPASSAPAVPPEPGSPAATVAPPSGARRETERDAPFVSPRARKLMEAHGLAMEAVRGLGKDRISEKDIQLLVAGGGARRRIGISAPRRAMIRRLVEGLAEAPCFSLRFSVVMDRLLDLRDRQHPRDAPERPSINDYLLRAVALRLDRSREMLYRYTPDGFEPQDAVNLGFAVSWEDELQVPVIRDACSKSVLEISRTAAELVRRVRSRTLRTEDVAGGGFTVSNLGMYGVDSFVPLINPPQAAILGIGAIRDLPWIREGAVVPARIMECTLVCDHRVIDGARGAGFCSGLKRLLEGTEEAAW